LGEDLAHLKGNKIVYHSHPITGNSEGGQLRVKRAQEKELGSGFMCSSLEKKKWDLVRKSDNPIKNKDGENQFMKRQPVGQRKTQKSKGSQGQIQGKRKHNEEKKGKTLKDRHLWSPHTYRNS